MYCGGDGEDRTLDLLNAIQALSQLSYAPIWRTSNNLFIKFFVGCVSECLGLPDSLRHALCNQCCFFVA